VPPVSMPMRMTDQISWEGKNQSFVPSNLAAK
jgi:hypothetical protein